MSVLPRWLKPQKFLDGRAARIAATEYQRGYLAAIDDVNNGRVAQEQESPWLDVLGDLPEIHMRNFRCLPLPLLSDEQAPGTTNGATNKGERMTTD